MRKKLLWLARYASAFARHDWEKMKKLAKVRPVGISSKPLYELTLQGYLFLGFPAAIEALDALDGTFISGKKKRERSSGLRVKKGERTCRKIYREKFPALMQNLKQKSPELAGWVIEEGYGKVLSRSGASLHLRELFNVALLAASGFPKQLFAHLRALIEMGERPEELRILVKEASKRLPQSTRGKIEKAVSLLMTNRNSVWNVPVSSI